MMVHVTCAPQSSQIVVPAFGSQIIPSVFSVKVTINYLGPPNVVMLILFSILIMKVVVMSVKILFVVALLAR